MDPFKQRMQRRVEEERLKKNLNKDFINIWSLPHQKIMDIGTEQNEKLRSQIEENSNEDEKLNIEAENVLNNFLHDALGSTSSLSTENCNTSGYCLETQKNDLDDSKQIVEECTEEPLHYTVHGYRALTRKQKIKSRSPLLSTTFNVKELKKVEIEDKQKLVKTLQEKLVSENAILQQTTKALKYCCNDVELCFSSQRAEWERQLLLSIHKHFAMTKKLECVKADILDGCPLHSESGQVQISDILLDFDKSAMFQNDADKWYVCLFSHDDDVKATQLYPKSRSSKDPIKELLTFSRLINDFTIKVQIFSLQLKQSKKKLLKNPLKKFQQNKNMTNIHDSSLGNVFKASDFHLEGFWDLRLENLNSTIERDFGHGCVRFNLTWKVELKVQLSGFLSLQKNIGEYYIWERKWCHLDGSIFQYWNDPSSAEKVPPLEKIDLRDCITTEVSPIDRDFDPRRKTFVLETKVSVSEKHTNIVPKKSANQKHLFRADTTKELLNWCMVLNKHLEILRKWKVMNNF